MIRRPNPVLDKEEQALLFKAPETCFQRAIGRGALSLEEVTARLPSHIATAVRSVAIGERLSMPERGPDAGEFSAGSPARALPPSEEQKPDKAGREYEWTLKALSEFPQLARLLGERVLTPDEAMQAAHAIDGILGRYLTGTRYAAP